MEGNMNTTQHPRLATTNAFRRRDAIAGAPDIEPAKKDASHERQ